MSHAVVRQRLGKMVVRYRRHAGLTQRQLAELLGVSPSAVAGWEQGHRWPDPPQLVKLIDQCRLNPAELFGTQPPPRARRVR
jgi:transcriptional regulator with XRE-family HTH domain